MTASLILQFVFSDDKNITLTRLTASENSMGSGCSTTAYVLVESWPGHNLIVSVDLGDSQPGADSGQISVPVSAGSQLEIFGLAATDCALGGTSPSDVMVNVQYVMQ